jgi:hypothetical protein
VDPAPDVLAPAFIKIGSELGPAAAQLEQFVDCGNSPADRQA